jgi:RimJ/RimL family protein N-acetyltransferase
MSEFTIRILDARDADAFQALRLRGLQEYPAAFASSYEEEHVFTREFVAARLGDESHGAVLGAYLDASLIGVMGVRREQHLKLAHKALLWGVYVAPEGRGHGVARRLGLAALDYAKTKFAARQITLGVGTWNAGAIKLYESLGFESFGIERDYLCIDGEYFDEMLMIRFFDDQAA